jgi:N-acetyl-1-D-myo-inositol-2-amino-2-deoxy-alpha-D-glucopyranoside deacetylase
LNLLSRLDYGLLMVHAHPDDESIPTGATLAHYATRGVRVCLVTCTQGERGEVVASDLGHLRDATPEELGRYRAGELAAALRELGVTRHVWLGGAGRWWDSGMLGTPENDDPRAFTRASLDDAMRELVAVLRTERPAVVVTYDRNGGSGHPDHIQAHHVTMNSVSAAADKNYALELGEAWRVSKVYWWVVSHSMALELAKASGFDFPADRGLPDDQITARIDGTSQVARKLAALRAHRSQVNLDNGGLIAHMAQLPEFAIEYYQLAYGQCGPNGPGEHGWEDDLFAGLHTAP